MSGVAFAAFLLLGAATATQDVCKSTDARGNVTYRDCPPRSTYDPAPARPVPTVEEEPPRAPEASKPSESKPRESARSFPWTTSRSAASPAAARQTYPIAGVPLLVLGMVVALVSSVSFLVAAFRVNLWWGLGCLFLSPVSPVFLILHWDVAKRPFLVSLAGVAAALVGYVLLGGGT